MTKNTDAANATTLSDRAGFLLSELGSRSAGRFAVRLGPLGIAPKHYGLMELLSRNEGLTQQQLGTTLGIHRNVMVGLVDDLEKRGLAERRRHPTDRRAHAIHLTESARGLLPLARSIADEHETELLSVLDGPERAQLLALLQRLAAQTGRPADVHPGLRGSRP